MSQTFQGSIVALVSPMTSDGQIDSDAYRRLLEFHLDAGTHGLVIGGTTGESPTLTADELEQMIAAAKEVVGGRIPVIAGSGSNGTAKTVELTRRVCAAGADGCLVVTPYYNKPTQDGLRLHYEAVAEAADKPVILYNVPGRTACDLLPATVAALAEHPRIVAVKEATASVGRALEIIERSDGAIDVLSGDDATALELIVAGARGVISVSANVAPAAMARVCAAALEGRHDDARRIDARLQPLHRALFVEPNPIPVKYAVGRMGLAGPHLRLPMTSLRADNQAAVLSALAEAGIEVTE